MSGSSPPSRPRWLFLFRPKWLSWHVFTIFAAIGMLWLGDWQFHRAAAGNGLSWAYTFEWPIFAVLGVVFWARTVLDEFRSPGSASQEAADTDLPTGAGALARSQPGSPAGCDGDDSQLTAYVARLSAEVRRHGRWHGLR